MLASRGYFRLEWKLALDRSHLLAPDQPFLLPVAIDDTPQSDERLPDRFRELQWTRLAGGDTPPAFVERIQRLLSPAAPKALPAGHARADAAAVPPSVSAGQRAPRSALSALIWASALVAVAAIVGYYAMQWPSVSRHTAPSAPLATVDAIPEKSIAVLPFLDMSEKKDQEYFSDGLAEELLDLLSQAPDLRVPARTSSFYFKGRTDDVATIARKLRVAHLLEGSVRRSGNTIRVTAQLIRADTATTSGRRPTTAMPRTSSRYRMRSPTQWSARSKRSCCPRSRSAAATAPTTPRPSPNT
jgi:TolB-like protein